MSEVTTRPAPSLPAGQHWSTLTGELTQSFLRPGIGQFLGLMLAWTVVVYLDNLTGPFIEFGLFYSALIVVACLEFGPWGLVFVFLSTGGYLVNVVLQDGSDGFVFRPANAFVRFGSFSVVGLISVMLHRARQRSIAHQRELEVAFAEREAVLHCLPEAVLILDPDLRVRQVGGQSRELLGVPQVESSAKTVRDLPVDTALGEYFGRFSRDPALPAERLAVLFPSERTLEVVPAPLRSQSGEFAGWVVVVRDVTEVVRSNELLLARARALAVQETRSRLARHLHDHVAQTLASVRMRLDVLADVVDEPDTHEKTLRTIQSALGQAIRDLRQTMGELRPTALEKLPFVQALESYSQNLTEHSGFEVRLSVEGPIRLAPEREVLLFYVIQEAVSNALKYSRAEGVDVRLQSKGSLLSVEVQDDGVGFDCRWVEDDPLRRSFGLQDMRDRARVMGADLEIESIQGRGTSVRLSVPIEREREEGP